MPVVLSLLLQSSAAKSSVKSFLAGTKLPHMRGFFLPRPHQHSRHAYFLATATASATASASATTMGDDAISPLHWRHIFLFCNVGSIGVKEGSCNLRIGQRHDSFIIYYSFRLDNLRWFSGRSVGETGHRLAKARCRKINNF